MADSIKEQLAGILEDSLKNSYPALDSCFPILVETPSDKQHGELSVNIALKSAKLLRKPPIAIAAEFKGHFEKALAQSVLKNHIAKIEVKNPGFINFFLTPQAILDIIPKIQAQGENFGRQDFGKKQKVQIEFVSANPTGPLSVAHARQAAVGDALGNVLSWLGFDVVKEYYINDEGNQINILGLSIKVRAQQLLGKAVDFPEDGYQGEYIKDMAQIFMGQKNIKTAADLEDIPVEEFRQFGVDYLLAIIKKELNDFGVHFDVWSSQALIASAKSIQAVVKELTDRGFVYEKDGAIWFRSTDFKDDKDRVLRKSDGLYTYLTPDIVYHKNKYDRGFDKIFNIWGPDHHGYIPRLKASVEALGHKRESLEVLIVQLATIYRNGTPVSMSTRRGQYISLQEVMDEVGVDAARFFFLMRHINAHLDFDLDLAKKETPENPVYYIQYAHARVHSINQKAKELNVQADFDNTSLLVEAEELDLAKILAQFPEKLLVCHNESDPYALVSYLQDLAAGFHRYYDKHKIVTDNTSLSSQRLGLVNASRIVLHIGLKLLGVSAPERM